jgi:ABC-type multidrug transport system ATPase subunit
MLQKGSPYQETTVGLSPISARSALYTLLMLTRHHHGVLFRDQASRSLRHICRGWNFSIAIEKNGHLLQSMTSRLRVEEVDRNAEKNEHDDEDKIVLPANAFEGNGVDKGVEEDGHHGSRQSDDQATRT